MLLRKHISNGRIVSVIQPGMERILEISIEHLNELGDLCRKKLVIEIMGKHSNIIFRDDASMIIDSIKHISSQVSSVREVLPGRTYVMPPAKGKVSLAEISPAWMTETLFSRAASLQKAIYSSLSGISPMMANEICYRAGLDGGASTASLSSAQQTALYGELIRLKTQLEQQEFYPCIVYQGNTPQEFSSLPLSMYTYMEIRQFLPYLRCWKRTMRKRSPHKNPAKINGSS